MRRTGTLKGGPSVQAEAPEPRGPGAWVGVPIGIISVALYLLVGFEKGGTDSHYLFAEAFLAGRLHVEGPYPWLELVPRPEGGWFTPFPPLLSVALMPFAALDIEVDTNHIAAVMGGISVALMWVLLGRLGVAPRTQLVLTVAWAVGSELLWVAGEGGQHLAPQVAAVALLLGSMCLGLGRQWPFLAGLLLALGAAARLPVGLALPLLLWLYRPPDLRAAGRDHRAWLLVLAGVLVPAVLVALYNAARFGDPTEFGYGLIRNVEGESVLDESWYSEGIVSLAYLPQGLHSMLLRGLELQATFPWVSTNIMGTSVLLTMPVLWWVFEARGRLAVVAAISALLVMLPNLLHGNPGFAQVGYRYILDALPLLWLLLGLAFMHRVSRAAAVALAAGVLVNAWISLVFWAELAP